MVPRFKMRFLSNVFGILCHFGMMVLLYYTIELINYVGFLVVEMGSYFYGFYIESMLRNKIFVQFQINALIISYITDIIFLVTMLNINCQYILWVLITIHSLMVLSEVLNLILMMRQHGKTKYLQGFTKIFYIGNFEKESYIAAQNKQKIQIIRISKKQISNEIDFSYKKTMTIDTTTEIESIVKNKNLLITQTNNQYLSFYTLLNLEFQFATPLYRKNSIRVWDEKGDVAYVHYSKETQTTDLDLLSIEDVFQKGISLELSANFNQKSQVIHYGNIKIDQNHNYKYIIARNFPSNDIISINLDKSDIDILYKQGQKNSIQFKVSETQILQYTCEFEPIFVIIDISLSLVGRLSNSNILSGLFPIQVKNLNHHIILYPSQQNRSCYFFLTKIQNNSLHILQKFYTTDTQVTEAIYDSDLNILITLSSNKIYLRDLTCNIEQANPQDICSLNISL